MKRQDVLQGFEAQARSRLITSVWTSLKPSPFAVLPVSTSLNSTPFVVPHRSTLGRMSPESLVEHPLMTRQDVLQGFEAQARSRLITSVWTSLKPSPFAVLPVSTSLNSTPFVVP